MHKTIISVSTVFVTVSGQNLEIQELVLKSADANKYCRLCCLMWRSGKCLVGADVKDKHNKSKQGVLLGWSWRKGRKFVICTIVVVTVWLHKSWVVKLNAVPHYVSVQYSLKRRYIINSMCLMTFGVYIIPYTLDWKAKIEDQILRVCISVWYLVPDLSQISVENLIIE